MEQQLHRFSAVVAALVLGCVTSCGAPARTIVASGLLASDAGATRGTATIYQLPDGTLSLELALSGALQPPADVRLALTDHGHGPVEDGFLTIGRLRSPDPRHCFSIPPGLDLGRVTAVVIWSHSTNASIVKAPLTHLGSRKDVR